MYRKNTASQFVCFQMLLTATGAVATGLSPAARRCIDGTFAAGGGTVTEDSAGFYKYAMAQADTNGNDISLTFSAATAMPVCINFVTTAADPTSASSFGLTNLDAAITSRMASYTQPTGFLAATFPAGTVANTTNITSITGNITGNLSGSVGSVTGAVGSVTGAVGSVTGLTASNLDATISSRMATYAQPTGFLAATFPTTVASPTNITSITGNITGNLSGSVGSVTTVSDKTGYALTSGERDSVADALLDRTAGVETSWTLRQAMRIMLSVLAGKASGLATTTALYRDMADSKNRISATVDSSGNRTAVTRDSS